jgi:hypothetical protein
VAQPFRSAGLRLRSGQRAGLAGRGLGRKTGGDPPLSLVVLGAGVAGKGRGWILPLGALGCRGLRGGADLRQALGPDRGWPGVSESLPRNSLRSHSTIVTSCGVRPCRNKPPDHLKCADQGPSFDLSGGVTIARYRELSDQLGITSHRRLAGRRPLSSPLFASLPEHPRSGRSQRVAASHRPPINRSLRRAQGSRRPTKTTRDSLFPPELSLLARRHFVALTYSASRSDRSFAERGTPFWRVMKPCLSRACII